MRPRKRKRITQSCLRRAHHLPGACACVLRSRRHDQAQERELGRAPPGFPEAGIARSPHARAAPQFPRRQPRKQLLPRPHEQRLDREPQPPRAGSTVRSGGQSAAVSEKGLGKESAPEAHTGGKCSPREPAPARAAEMRISARGTLKTRRQMPARGSRTTKRLSTSATKAASSGPCTTAGACPAFVCAQRRGADMLTDVACARSEGQPHRRALQQLRQLKPSVLEKTCQERQRHALPAERALRAPSSSASASMPRVSRACSRNLRERSKRRPAA